MSEEDLIKCPMCGKMISPNAEACPNCGEPMHKKHKKKEKFDYSKYIHGGKGTKKIDMMQKKF